VLGASVKYQQPSLKVRPFSEIYYTSTLLQSLRDIFANNIYFHVFQVWNGHESVNPAGTT
jgi:hypothetical protein